MGAEINLLRWGRKGTRTADRRDLGEGAGPESLRRGKRTANYAEAETYRPHLSGGVCLMGVVHTRHWESVGVGQQAPVLFCVHTFFSI
jgi:hypothetical protein